MITTSAKEEIRQLLLSSGAITAGFAEAGMVDQQALSQYEEWINEGMHAGMDYLERHAKLKQTPENVLEGTRTVISLAFSYATGPARNPELPMIACYALGEDYHDVLRKRLKPVLKELKEKFGGTWRICIDSAPLAERYWALKAGIGIKGRNGSVIVPGAGTLCFLVEVLTTLEIEADETVSEECEGCGACLNACPTGALGENGLIDARKCLSYLTIEHRGDWSEKEKKIIACYEKGIVLGCDICMKVCPHNRGIYPTAIKEFMPRREIMELTAEQINKMDEEKFKSIFQKNPMKRAGLQSLKRNVANCCINVKK